MPAWNQVRTYCSVPESHIPCWIARACVAPIRVNFHIEHHLMVSAPYFRLPKLHSLLLQRGIVPQPPTYLQVLKRVSMRAHNV